MLFLTVSEVILKAYIPTHGNSGNLWHGTPQTNPTSTGYPAIVLCSRPFSRIERLFLQFPTYDSYEYGTRIREYGENIHYNKILSFNERLRTCTNRFQTRMLFPNGAKVFDNIMAK